MDDQVGRECPEDAVVSASWPGVSSRSMTSEDVPESTECQIALEDLLFIAGVVGDLHALASTQALPALHGLVEASMVALATEWPKPHVAGPTTWTVRAGSVTSLSIDRESRLGPQAFAH